jgi:chromate reductase, NAD(P)H dehydrogenase (quinone)
MHTKKRILAICGSTRKNSLNLSLISAIISLSDQIFDIRIFGGLTELPHFNPDIDNENPPEAVADFRRQLREAEGILISAPEYAMGVPGSLKNAVDWTVSSCEFSKKPVALITASLNGEKAHASLLETLNIIEARIVPETTLLISFAKTKISAQNEITDPSTRVQVEKLISAFHKLVNQSKENSDQIS